MNVLTSDTAGRLHTFLAGLDALSRDTGIRLADGAAFFDWRAEISAVERGRCGHEARIVGHIEVTDVERRHPTHMLCLPEKPEPDPF